MAIYQKSYLVYAVNESMSDRKNIGHFILPVSSPLHFQIETLNTIFVT